MNRGIIYIIGGKKYAEWTLKSIISLRRNGGGAGELPVHIHFIGKYEFEEIFNQLGCTCILHASDEMSHHVHRKTKSIVMEKHIPFDQYIMIDADTFVQGDFMDMFDLIPEGGVAGIEDGNFQSHLQMAEFLFLRKKKGRPVRELVKEMLNVDYGAEEQFPPYFNVGVIGFSREASAAVGAPLFDLLYNLSKNDHYNPHDEQLPMNSIFHRQQIPAVAVDPIFNYTRSRMRKNKKLGIHDTVKGNVRIIHNRHYPKEADWIDLASVNKEYEALIDRWQESKSSQS
jgi:lipopolysaccharide biosynthesis glycosyltransferase